MKKWQKMIELRISSKFRTAHKKFIKNDSARKEAVASALRRFSQYATYPSLHLEKLGGSKYWTMRVDKGNRIFFMWIDKQIILLIDIGSHDKYKKY